MRMRKYVKMVKQTAAKIAEAARRASRARADAAEWQRRCEILAENSRFLQRRG